MKIRYLIAASAAALIAAGSAQAADIIYEPPVPMFSWQGFYFGGQIGGSWADASVRARNLTGTPSTRRFSPDPDGFVGGLYAGYNFDAGNNVILGLDTDFVWSDLEDSSYQFTPDDHYYRARVKQKWVGSTRIRFGYGVDRWLPYIAAGVAYGKIDAGLRDITLPLSAGGPNVARSISKTLTGWTVGVGTDYAITDNVLVRLEYRYTDLGDKSFGYITDLHGKVKYKTNDFRVGVAYKF